MMSQQPHEECFHTSLQNLSQLWHQRYGHLSYKGLKTLQSKKMVRGLPNFTVSDELCEDCIVGKHHRDPIPKKSSWRVGQILGLIHADICGPITPMSNSNKRYSLCFIDDYSRKSWMYFLSEKSEALSHFKCFKKMVENETDLPIKCVRTDRGGEFTSVEFNNFCMENGIKRQLTTAYTPQRSVAEWKNRTVSLLLIIFGVVVSRDVIFEEDRQWNWDESYEEQILVDLEEEDDDAGVGDINSEGDENIDGVGNNGENIGENEIDSGDRGNESPNNGDSEDNGGSTGKRVGNRPGWMRDYVSGEDLGLSEDESNMALMVSSDPLYYEEAKVGVKWIYKTKYNEHGELEKHKARLVAKGYTQKHGIDYTEVYAPVARMETVRMVVALAAQRNWKIFQLDVKSTFLHGELDEDIYVEQPKGYEVKGSEDKVYKLHKALYGLKQAPRAWFSRIETYFLSEGFERCPNEQTLFTKAFNDASF
ncbi:unnamed protein product [Fraxinus pennsylvanica]|uniref:Integrase catalytic domain-containing protein n=1 Tax=Fraxinus pennsylvanica TaxID=56036 RepID=A0AAD2AGD9_9LAMI|nr:unnamed protein product [Fraxinus pennsylvanica]